MTTNEQVIAFLSTSQKAMRASMGCSAATFAGRCRSLTRAMAPADSGVDWTVIVRAVRIQFRADVAYDAAIGRADAAYETACTLAFSARALAAADADHTAACIAASKAYAAALEG